MGFLIVYKIHFVIFKVFFWNISANLLFIKRVINIKEIPSTTILLYQQFFSLLQSMQNQWFITALGVHLAVQKTFVVLSTNQTGAPIINFARLAFGADIFQANTKMTSLKSIILISLQLVVVEGPWGQRLLLVLKNPWIAFKQMLEIILLLVVAEIVPCQTKKVLKKFQSFQMSRIRKNPWISPNLLKVRFFIWFKT